MKSSADCRLARPSVGAAHADLVHQMEPPHQAEAECIGPGSASVFGGSPLLDALVPAELRKLRRPHSCCTCGSKMLSTLNHHAHHLTWRVVLIANNFVLPCLKPHKPVCSCCVALSIKMMEHTAEAGGAIWLIRHPGVLSFDHTSLLTWFWTHRPLKAKLNTAMVPSEPSPRRRPRLQ